MGNFILMFKTCCLHTETMMKGQVLLIFVDPKSIFFPLKQSHMSFVGRHNQG